MDCVVTAADKLRDGRSYGNATPSFASINLRARRCAYGCQMVSLEVGFATAPEHCSLPIAPLSRTNGPNFGEAGP